MDNFDLASARARVLARELIEDDIPPAIIADALIAQGLAVWAADTGRHQSAQTVLTIWTKIRDAR